MSAVVKSESTEETIPVLSEPSCGSEQPVPAEEDSQLGDVPEVKLFPGAETSSVPCQGEHTQAEVEQPTASAETESQSTSAVQSSDPAPAPHLTEDSVQVGLTPKTDSQSETQVEAVFQPEPEVELVSTVEPAVEPVSPAEHSSEAPSVTVIPTTPDSEEVKIVPEQLTQSAGWKFIIV